MILIIYKFYVNHVILLKQNLNKNQTNMLNNRQNCHLYLAYSEAKVQLGGLGPEEGEVRDLDSLSEDASS